MPWKSFRDIQFVRSRGILIRHGIGLRLQRAPSWWRQQLLNSINKLAAGIADNYALTVLSELLGAGVPTAVVPFVNTALASRVAYQSSLQVLRAEGVRIIEGAVDQWLPHPAGTGEIQAQKFPWLKALEVLQVMAKP